MDQQTSALVRVMPFYYGWWVVIAAAIIILVASVAPLYAFSTLVDPLEEEFGWSRAAIGAGPSIAALMAGLTLPVAGYTADRIGVRRLLVAGVVLIGGGFLAVSQVQTLWQFYISVSVIAIGMSMAGLPVCAIAVAHWFVKRRGRALGVLSAGEGASGIMVLLAAVLIGLFGWRSGLMILGAAQLALCIPLAFTVPHRPQEMGLLPDGELAAQKEALANPPPEAVAGTGGDSRIGQPEGLSLSETLHTRSFWFLVIAVVLLSVGFLAVIIHLIAYLDESAGLTEQGAAMIAMGIPLGSLVGRISFGWLADYVSKRWLLAVAWLVEGLGILIFAAVQNPWQAILFLAVFAPAYGAALPVLPALLAEYFGLRAFGAIQGFMWGMATLASFTGPIFAGAVYDMVDSYRSAFLLLAIAALAAGLAVMMMGRPPIQQIEAAEASAA
ncbi:MAG: MFS transporter [Dehalococcoidia bacterium]